MHVFSVLAIIAISDFHPTVCNYQYAIFYYRIRITMVYDFACVVLSLIPVDIMTE